MKRFWYWFWGPPEPPCEHNWEEYCMERFIHYERSNALEPYIKHEPPLRRETLIKFCTKCAKKVVLNP